MPAVQINDKLLTWASQVESNTIVQAAKASRLDVVAGHVALMPDAHVGIGATVGSVIPTENAIIPSAVGVDIGCGMIAVETNLGAGDLPDSLNGYLRIIEQRLPAGVGQGHGRESLWGQEWLTDYPNPRLTDSQRRKALEQFGSLGSGNHFFEVCLDERDQVWLVLHSGSRGIGNQLAVEHIKKAKVLARDQGMALEDPDLAYFIQGTPEFSEYMDDLLWAQQYALANRTAMMKSALNAFFQAVTPGGADSLRGQALTTINCHHNYTSIEVFDGRELYITRKGAIKADKGDLGVIPGSMGTRSYIVRGLGNPLSWNSCSHGAGRRMSRSQAKKTFTAEDLADTMSGKTWLASKAQSLVDEIPHAYKDIDVVMKDQEDLVEVVHTLSQVLNYKGC